MPKRTIKVFIASPGDLAIERRAFKDKIDELNKGFGRGADVEFLPLGWEDALSTVGRRSQSVINRDVDACDVFILVMWRRWGQEAPDAVPYSSYTEEEFYRAMDRFEKSGSPEIMVFFKHIDQGQMADPGEQLKKVLDFRKKLERSRKALFRGFVDENAFREEIDCHLTAFATGGNAPIRPDSVPIVPDSLQSEIDKLKKERANAEARLKRAEARVRELSKQKAKSKGKAKAKQIKLKASKANLAEAKAEALSLALAESAAKAALDGRIEEARQNFSKALDGTTNLRVLYLGYQFYERIGDLDEAEGLLKRWLAISGPDAETADTTKAYRMLGNVAQVRGDLDGAEGMYRKALAIDEKLGNLEGVARNYSNLGIILQARGDLDGAEAMLRQALAIEEKLGRLDGVASLYGNLGIILQARGDLDGAEAMLRKGLAIDEPLGRFEYMANMYGNLGVVLRTRDDLGGAEAMYRKALAIDERLGRLDGMASDYQNLGSVAEDQKDFAEARRLWTLSRDMWSKLGAKHNAKEVQGYLDQLPPA